MKPIFLTLNEHGSVTFSVRPEHPESLRRAASQLCDSGTHKRFVEEGEDVDTQPTLDFTVKRQGACIDITVQAWYYVGFDWIIPGMLGVHVLPKLEQDACCIDILGMLRKALTERENLDHLEGLLHIDFQQPALIDAEDSAGLNLFVVTAYLNVLERIVRKGLKRNFYSCDEIYRRKLRGSILFSKTIAGQHSSRFSDRLCCRRQDFGINVPANQVLKCALRRKRKFSL